MKKYTLRLAGFALAALLSVAAHAQVTNQDDNVARPVDAYAAQAPMPANPSLPSLWIVGDSTAQNKADLGWGDHLSHYVDTSRINVVNRARAGRSSRTFMHEGAWDLVLASLKPGDYVLIQMGHNDGGDLDGAKPRGTLKGVGEESKEVTLPNGSHETVHTFGWYLRKYITDARAKGATPLLLGLTVRNIWTAGHIERDMGYDGFIQQVGVQTHVPYLDVSNVEADRLEKLGPEATAKLFPIDHTHTSADGAELVAGSVAEALRRDGTLARYLK
ncbi:rhamnogalacturonan acetylesterase [Terriglobus roseus]|uniref:Lysophospholipase L1 n=1 Tax=Terriglobus roseus TaxID=392734 RepID=A0A1H4LS86_9BACT|nr:rhamnogalacturonan acetylesterase [Terriglobus roseus]SEB73533.1 Lysophospholipase L1 [Terriglobus roseus]